MGGGIADEVAELARFRRTSYEVRRWTVEVRVARRAAANLGMSKLYRSQGAQTHRRCKM